MGWASAHELSQGGSIGQTPEYCAFHKKCIRKHPYCEGDRQLIGADGISDDGLTPIDIQIVFFGRMGQFVAHIWPGRSINVSTAKKISR